MMNIISLVDTITLSSVIAALFIFARHSRTQSNSRLKWLLLTLLLMMLFDSLSNVFEWTGITNALDVYEDFLELLTPIVWGILFYGLIQTNSEQKLQAYADLLEREKDLVTQITQTSPAGIVMVDPAGQINFANLKAEQVLGLTKDEILQRTYNAPAWHITDEDGQPFPEEMLPFNQVMSTGQQILDCRHAIVWPDGRQRLLSINAAPLVDSEGQVDGMVATVEDITQRRQAEKDLIKSEERYRNLFEGAAEGIIVVDIETKRIKQANAAFCQMLGYEENQLKQKTIADLHPAEALEDVLAEFEAQALGEKILASNIPCLKKDGTLTYADIATTKIIIDEVPCNVGFFTNVMARKQAEEALKANERRYRHELEELVEARTAELESANEQLQHLSRIKDEFFSNVSHELRTPITSIKLYHQLLKQNPQKKDVYMDTLEREIQRMVMLVENLLQLSRFDQEAVQINFESFNLNSIVELLVADRIAIANENGLILHSNLDTELPILQADPNKLSEVLSILLTNALNYTPSGGVITVSTCSQQHQRRQGVSLSIKDTGPGIPLDEQKHLFERFFRGSVGVSSQTPGTGLGLSIAKEIVDLHQGNIECVSDGIPGQGTIFNIWLPLKKGESVRAKSR